MPPCDLSFPRIYIGGDLFGRATAGLMMGRPELLGL